MKTLQVLRSPRHLVATITVACLLCAGLTAPRVQTAEACSPGFFFDFEHFLEAETLDDLHRPDGPYAQWWQMYLTFGPTTEDDPEPPRITHVSLVHTVAEVHAPSTRGPALLLFGGVTTLQHRWGQDDGSENPRTESLRLNISSCNFDNYLPDHGDDIWFLHNDRDWRLWRTSRIPTAELVVALTRLFGEPVSPDRDIDREGEIIAELTGELEERSDPAFLPVEPAAWLNPATGQVEPWDGAPENQPPIPTFTG